MKRDSWEKSYRDLTIVVVLFEAACVALMALIIAGVVR